MTKYNRKVTNGKVRANISYDVGDFEFIAWLEENKGVNEQNFIRMAIKEKIESIYQKAESLKQQARKKAKDLNNLL